MSEVDEVDDDLTGTEKGTDVGEGYDADRRLVVEYEEDPIENYDTRLLLIGLALSFLFGLGVGIVAFVTQGGV
jgi:hypothetical protein